MQRISNETDKAVGELVIYLCNLTGITNDKMPLRIDILVGYIKNNMKAFSMLDFVNGFTLAIGGKLDLSDPNPYSSFSTLYIEKVMQSYNRYRFNIIEEEKKHSNMVGYDREQGFKTVQLSETEKEKALFDWFSKTFEIYKEKGKFMNYNSPLYSKLMDRGIINFSEQKKNAIISKVQDCFRARRRNIEAKTVGDAIIEMNTSDMENGIAYFSLIALFDDMIEMEIEAYNIFSFTSKEAELCQQ